MQINLSSIFLSIQTISNPNMSKKKNSPEKRGCSCDMIYIKEMALVLKAENIIKMKIYLKKI